MSYARASSSRSPSHLNGGEPEPQPSLPASPIEIYEEQDLSGISPHQHDDDDDDDPELTPVKTKSKRVVNGKGKARVDPLDVGEDDAVEWEGVDGYAGTHYPPIKEDDDESKRIEENLRRWDHAERKRRKAARERDRGDSISSNRSSVVGDVSRRASSLWKTSTSNKRMSKVGPPPHPRGLGHTVLRQTSEDALPLTDLNGSANSRGLRTPSMDPYASPGSSQPASPYASMPNSPDPGYSATSSKSNGALRAPIPTIAIVENPFDPPGSFITPKNFDSDVANAEEHDGGLGESAVMSPSTSPPPPTPAASRVKDKSPFDDPDVTTDRTPNRPTLQATSSFSGHPLAQPPKPMPLDIPPPKTPPPRTLSTAPITTPPKPKPQLHSTVRQGEGNEQVEEEEEKRWWTDWLCGCRESGDSQSGRTNPLE